ncbi:MAG: hypothetical protein A3C36_00825 [Omnitrophica WOR_2 bacterium RIFCSPHIGHO2_02_FULL_52_10]|nr:MAG: hypothetical protein A3C36_00825 [Omnitrophica WOR_2 bacterium RIFCSPHIGHO2_02_FULL_52_10]
MFALTSFVVFITFQPYLLHHEIIMMETGIHLPGLRALFHGAVPYRDFLYFRGPLELYVPAMFMRLFGENMIWLPVFYYAATALTLIFAVALAFQLYRTRFALYLMVPVFVARTFPRVSFYYWGGMRYALGLLALVFAVQGFRTDRRSWMLGAGVVSCLAFWTTIEAGVCTVFAVGGALVLSWMFRVQERGQIAKLLRAYMAGFLLIFLPVAAVMAAQGALGPYVQTTYIVLTKSFKTFPNGPGLHPVGVAGFLAAMVPGDPFFQSMTPVYFYILLFACFLYRTRKGMFNGQLSCLISVALYGVILYVTGFRRLDGHHFEMALQPEKILYFFILEEACLFILSVRSREAQQLEAMALAGWGYLWARKKIYAVNFLIIAFVGSSLGYAITRYSRRFVMFKLIKGYFSGGIDKDLSLLHDVEKRAVNIDRARGMVVPVWQAEEMEGIVGFLEKNTEPDEAVFTYPELGNFNFWADRPFVGRFPIATFSWMDERWHAELVADLKKNLPRYVVMTNPGHRTFPQEWYFRNKANIKKHDDMTRFILERYEVLRPYESVSLYKRK